MKGVLAIFELPSGGEWLLILFVGLLVFGRRLPEVARSMGKSIAEFKRGLSDTIDDRRSMVAPPHHPPPPPPPAHDQPSATNPADNPYDPSI